MSRKHVDDYFNQLYSDYLEMIEALKDMEEECKNGIVSPDRVEQLKNMLEPIKINYERISYIIFLLNMPNKKEKRRWYDKQHSKIKFNNQNTLEGVRQENKQALEDAKKSL